MQVIVHSIRTFALTMCYPCLLRHKNSFSIDVKLRSDVAVADTHSKHIIWA